MTFALLYEIFEIVLYVAVLVFILADLVIDHLTEKGRQQ